MVDEEFPPYLSFVVVSILLGAFQYGYHNGELNTPQDVITRCHASYKPEASESIDNCIPMPEATYALIVSLLTAGGLVGALCASFLSDYFGRRLTLFGTNTFLAVGSLVTTLALTAKEMMVGRFISGIGCGILTVIVPAYLAECVPQSRRGFFGALNQLAIVVGIMASQIIGLFWATDVRWRWILAVGVFLAIVQSAMLPFCVDSPRYLASLPGGFNRAKESLLKLRGTSVEQVENEINEWRRDWANNTNQIEQEEQEQLVGGAVVQQHSSKVNIFQFLTRSHYRRPVCLIALLHLAQQLSGINAVIFFSTNILVLLYPESAAKITVDISFINLIMTMVSASLMDKLGRRTLFLASCGLMALMSACMAYGLSRHDNILAAVGVLGFVAAFAVGLGPIPFLMIPELVETEAVSSACSFGISVNMISNFLVTAGFHRAREVVGSGEVFYYFTFFLTVLAAIGYKILPETKNRSAEEVIRSGYSIKPCHYEGVRIPEDEDH